MSRVRAAVGVAVALGIAGAALYALAPPTAPPLRVDAPLPQVERAFRVPLWQVLWVRDAGDADLCRAFGTHPDAPALRAELLGEGALGYAAVELRPDAVVVDGEVVQALDDGRLSDSSALDAVLAQRAAATAAARSRCGQPHDPALALAVDGRIGWSTLQATLVSAARAGFGRFHLLVQAAEPTPAPRPPEPGARRALARVGSDEVTLTDLGSVWDGELPGDPTSWTGPELAPLLSGLGGPLLCALVAAEGDVAVSRVAAQASTLATHGAMRAVVVAVGGAGEAAPVEATASSAIRLPVEGPAWVLPLELPRAGRAPCTLTRP